MQRQAASKAAFDAATAKRDNDKAKVLQAQADTKQAQINLDYTKVVAPFDGIVTARQVSVGELVGGSGTQVLATIVQLDPIYVNFNASERDVLHVRDMLYKRGQRATDLLGTEVEVGLQTDQGYPHKGKLDYIAPTVNQGTGTLAARAELPNALRLMLPGFFVRVRVPLEETQALLVPSVALGSDQAGRYVLVVNGENTVEQRKVEVGPTVGEMAVIESGLKPDDRVVTAGLLRAIPGQKVDPQTQTAARSSRAMISRYFIERPVLANVLAILMIVIGAVALLVAAGRAISRRHAADRAGLDPLSGRERAHADRHRRAADRAAGERRREHDLHAVDEHVGRHLHAHRHVQDRHRPQLRAGAGAEPRLGRALLAARCGAEAGRQRPEAVDRDPVVRHADLARQDASTASTWRTTPRSA